jgi:hypothetical protein
MSELAKNIKAYQTNERFRDYAKLPNYLTIKSEVNELSYPDLPEFSHGYRIELTIGVTAKISGNNKDELNGVLRNTREYLVNIIFGEFRGPLLELKRALHDHDFKSSMRLADEILNQMFLEGI